MDENYEKQQRPSMPSRQPSMTNSSHFELLDKKEIERLGRVRPEAFKSAWSEFGFVLSICMSQILVVSTFGIYQKNPRNADQRH